LRLTSDGKYLAAIISPGGTNMPYVGIWETSTGKFLSHLNIVINGISNLQFSQDGKMLVLGDGENVFIYNITNPAQPVIIQTIEMRNASLVFSSDEKYLSVGGTDGTITFLDVQNQWSSVFSFKAAEFGRIDSQLFLPDGKTLLTTGHDGAIHVWGVTRP
jgi:WD40 repeat protein